jgi:hypothetical protein
MRAHVTDGDGLTRGSGSSHRCWFLDIVRTDRARRSAANLGGRAELAPGERSGAGDERSRAVITRCRRLEQAENALGAVGSPRRH